MSLHAIHLYYSEVEKMKHYGGTNKETAIRNAFYHLLNEYSKQKGLIVVPEITIKAANGKNVTPDGTLKDSLRQDWGYWESKDEEDDIDEEIQKKFAKGYPKENILFEDSNTAVLIQNGIETMRVPVKDEKALDRLLNSFMNYERPEVRSFRDAINHFKEDIPQVTAALRDIIEQQEVNTNFVKKRKEFLELCKEAINPEVNEEDVKEMMLQHILTADIFNTIFDEPHFHRENNVAKELETVVDTFFTRAIRQQTLNRIKHYYDTINATAAGIADHHEKQKFLKVVYETFYKSYNPKAADRLGVVYTPNEIVRFMVESTDYLLHTHFGKFLEDKGVEILDPATGTGTFLCDIIDHIRKDKLEYKYKNELHANEVAILPYYISNLNIEFTYKQKMGQYAEFEHLCFMDTLDNLEFKNLGRLQDMFNPFTEENSRRIMRQNSKKMMVVIGNPPYNANQQNENDNNKNREYVNIDKRIKETFIKNSTAQKTKMYDMYARFYRWAFDRIHDKGMIAFITNRSFVDSRTFDGFRKVVFDEFDFAYIIDTKSDVRANPKIAGTTHNVFGIQTGVAVMFLIKKETTNKKKSKNCTIYYTSLEDNWRKEEKLRWFNEHRFNEISFDHIIPDKVNNWIGQSTENDWGKLIPVCSKDAKLGRNERALFSLYTQGLKTNRNDWVYDFDKSQLLKKVEYFRTVYNSEIERWNLSDRKMKIEDFVDRSIKWTAELEDHLLKEHYLDIRLDRIVNVQYRPFIKLYSYVDRIITHRLYNNEQIFGLGSIYQNSSIFFSGVASSKPFQALVTNSLTDYDCLEKPQGLPLYRYDRDGSRFSNITAWGLEQFHKKYKNRKITEEDIFHYTYAVLHNPAYREKYALNLKQEFPRIPFYKDFEQWATWGKALMELHIDYETVEPYGLHVHEVMVDLAAGVNPDTLFKAKLKADKAQGEIVLDSLTTISGIPKEAWEYKLGNRSALEWILDQYKESKPKDPTIAEKFNTYRFADYKEQVIDLLQRVCTVSVRTMKIVGEMKDVGE